MTALSLAERLVKEKGRDEILKHSHNAYRIRRGRGDTEEQALNCALSDLLAWDGAIVTLATALRTAETSLALATTDLRAGVAEIERLRAREAELVALLREARQKLFSDGHRDYDDDDCDICLWLRDIKAKLAQIDAATNTAGEKS